MSPLLWPSIAPPITGRPAFVSGHSPQQAGEGIEPVFYGVCPPGLLSPLDLPKQLLCISISRATFWNEVPWNGKCPLRLFDCGRGLHLSILRQKFLHRWFASRHITLLLSSLP